LRFDVRGMGDSEGPRRGFEHLDDDLRAAVDALCRELPRVRGVVLWGLCDGASASAFYAARDARVVGTALVNPWVRTDAGEAEAVVRHYYRRRLMTAAFWRKFAAGGIRPDRAIGEFARTAWLAFTQRAASTAPHDGGGDAAAVPLPARLGLGVGGFAGAVLVGLSGNDRVAEEFRLASARPGPLATALGSAKVESVTWPHADHTFSSAQWQEEAAAATLVWIERRIAPSLQRTDQ
jgi:exosortase A-associated hydrolase 1